MVRRTTKFCWHPGFIGLRRILASDATPFCPTIVRRTAMRAAEPAAAAARLTDHRLLSTA
jgi:hypothetical protein